MSELSAVNNRRRKADAAAPLPRRGSLVKRFMKAAAKIALTVFAAATLTYAGYLGTHYAGKGQPLTAGEITLVESVFGDEVDPGKIRKHFRKTSIAHRMASPTVAGMVLPPLSHIDFYGKDHHSPDFSKETPGNTDLFMHEVTHVWQNQNGYWSLHHIDKLRLYDYSLSEKSDFNKFALEQKAEMIGDYVRIWLHPQGKVQSGKTPNEKDILLRDVVEKRFPRAKKTRMDLPAPVKPAATKSAPKMPNS